MKSNYLQFHSLKAVLLGIVLLIGTGIVFTSCSKKDENVIGTWQVSEGRDKGAVYKFTEDDRLYIYNKYEAEKKIEKLSDSANNDTISSGLLGTLHEQGNYKWLAKNKIQFYDEKYLGGDLLVRIGSVYIITESSKLKLKIEEMNWEYGTEGIKELNKSDEITLVHYNIK